MVSGLSHDETRLIADAPGVARNTNGPLASAELFVIIDLPKRATGTDANVPLRGVEQSALAVRDHLKIVRGRMFDWGKDEVIVGEGAVQEFAGLDVGSKIKVGRYEWPVVGVFSANGGSGGIGNLDRRQGVAGRLQPRRLVPVGLRETEFARRVPAVQGFAHVQSAVERAGFAPVRLLRPAIRNDDAADHDARLFGSPS